jgi:hypothetical protein
MLNDHAEDAESQDEELLDEILAVLRKGVSEDCPEANITSEELWERVRPIAAKKARGAKRTMSAGGGR